MKQESRLIRVKEKTYLEIKKQGFMGESFDNVLQRILDMHKIKDKSISKKEKKIADKL